MSDLERSPERVARAGLTRVIERGTPAAAQTFAGLTHMEIWNRLRHRALDMGPWLMKMEHADPERDLDRAAEIGARFIIPGDDEWPVQLEALALPGQLDAWSSQPFGLWVRGTANASDLLSRSVSVVGARASSAYGDHIAGELAVGLTEKDFTIVASGSYGIDASAHRGALAAAGPTIAILSSGVDVDYPRGNTARFERITADGLLISELPPGSPPTQARQYARNRLVAAASLGTVVAEAGPRSTTMNTAGWARRCSRPLMALPGPVTSATSAGAHELIRRHGATLVTCVDDVLETLGVSPQQPTRDLERTIEISGLRVSSRIARAVVTGVDKAIDAAGESLTRDHGPAW